MPATDTGIDLLSALDKLIKSSAPDGDAMLKIIDERIAAQAARRLEVYTPGDVKRGEVTGRVRPEFDRIARDVMAGINVMLVGPAGCGKTHLGEQLSSALGLRFAFISLTAGISESALIGRFVPIGAGGAFQYVPAEFADFYENGGLFLADESDAADPNVLLVMNAALANGHLATPNPAKPRVKRHPDFRMVAAANTWGHGASREYVGRNQMDAAFLDRFTAGKYALDYDEVFEREAGDVAVVNWVHALRRDIRAHKIRRIASTRLVLDGTTKVAAGATLAELQESYFTDWADNEKNLLSTESRAAA